MFTLAKPWLSQKKLLHYQERLAVQYNIYHYKLFTYKTCWKVITIHNTINYLHYKSKTKRKECTKGLKHEIIFDSEIIYWLTKMWMVVNMLSRQAFTINEGKSKEKSRARLRGKYLKPIPYERVALIRRVHHNISGQLRQEKMF